MPLPPMWFRRRTTLCHCMVYWQSREDLQDNLRRDHLDKGLHTLSKLRHRMIRKRRNQVVPEGLGPELAWALRSSHLHCIACRQNTLCHQDIDCFGLTRKAHCTRSWHLRNSSHRRMIRSHHKEWMGNRSGRPDNPRRIHLDMG